MYIFALVAIGDALIFLQARNAIEHCKIPAISRAYNSELAIVMGASISIADGKSTMIRETLSIAGIAPYRAKNPCALRIAHSSAVVAIRGR